MSLKTIQNIHMDAMAIQMDCRDKLTLALADINKSLGFGQLVNGEIEGQMRLRRVRKGEYADCKAK